MSSEEDSVSSLNLISEEKKFDIETDKKNKMELFLRIYDNDEFSITIYSKNEYPSRKFEFKSNLEEIQKNRFFKIFINVDEIMRELENKIERSTFYEENDLINIDIPIGLIIIENINFIINLKEKTLQETIDELNKKINEQTEEINKKKLEIKKLLKEVEKMENEHEFTKKELQIKMKQNSNSKNKNYINLMDNQPMDEKPNMNKKYMNYMNKEPIKNKKISKKIK